LAVCDAFDDEKDKKYLARDLFNACELALIRLLVQDCLHRFTTSREYEKYRTRKVEMAKIFPKIPLLQDLRVRLAQSFGPKYATISTIMPDLSMVDGKGGVRGSIVCHNASAERTITMILGKAFCSFVVLFGSVFFILYAF
jgi:hypothetical protein